MSGTTRPQAKRPVSAALAGPYGHPFHPMLVTVPIGAWVASLVFDVASLFVSEPEFPARAAMWLIGLGVIGALAAAMAGFLDLLAIPPGTRAFRVGLTHMTLNLLVTAAYAGGFWWRHAGPPPSGGVEPGQLALNAASLAVLAASGYLGGMLAYRYGVRVADETTQAEGFVPANQAGTDQAGTDQAGTDQAGTDQADLGRDDAGRDDAGAR